MTDTVSGWHIGRSFVGHELEDECPCPKEPCGLVARNRVDPECSEHPMARAKTIRQSHVPGRCEPELLPVALQVCRACLEAVPGECHAPGCFFWMSRADEVPAGLSMYVLAGKSPSVGDTA